ncbi:MAG TPA: DNA ligase D [Ferruginibacter sp.]|nr:DNA ligase D [Ferruginibacter sp.]
MSLVKYKQKRSFAKTPEPKGGRSSYNQLRFVIQKHAASHLHYDFRLEMDGVLKSWAVPKGPSTDPTVKRLAMMVEDHPFDYRNFEGIIPKGNYGGGTVIIWDKGTYEPDDNLSTDKKTAEKDLLKQLKAGMLKFTLHGKKLKGSYALVKTNGRGENSWLLIKHRDKYASEKDITTKEKSVVSNKTLKQIAAAPENIYGQQQSSKEKAAVKKKSAPKENKEIGIYLNKTKKTAFPKKITPMLATLVDAPFDEDGWLYEVKWDGYRTVAFINKDKVELKSRNDKSFNKKFYPIYDAVKRLGFDAVLDGEIVVLDDKGKSDFGDLQNWRSEADGELFYYVFDILWLNGKDLTKLTLAERRAILKDTIRNEGAIRVSENFKEKGTVFFEMAKKLGLEGIMAKKSDSLYHEGVRSDDWLKIKSNKGQEVIIGGFTKNDDSSKLFSALLVGVFDKGKLQYTGKIGTGFNEATQAAMMKQFKPLITTKIPFVETPDINKPSRFRPDPPHATVSWLKPKLICEVSFTEMTTDGVIRHPSFKGMRIDKKAAAVIREKEMPTTKIIKEEKMIANKKIIVPAGKTSRKTLLNPTDETQVRDINGHELKFTNLSKIYWPKEKLTKRDMINYYYQAAPYILPYLKDRPQSLNRFPNGITGESFYQKDVTGKVPDWVKTFLYHSQADDKDRHYLVGTDEASLLYMTSLGCIELNPWSSRIQSPDKPDWCIIDLDPDENNFNQVIETALVTKSILDSMKIDSYCKTSGSTGIHIYIPLGAKYSYEQSKEFARVIVRLVHEQLPKFTSIERVKSNRKGKIYLDFLQNRPQATIAAPYSLRPKPGATVSMPLHWEEVKKGLKMTDFTITNAIDRLKNERDIFKPVMGKGINLEKIVKDF